MMRSVLLAAAAATTMAAPLAAQDDPVNLRFGVWVGPTHPLMQGTQAWMDAIEEASDGSIEITLYPSRQLGAAVDHYDLARDGIADITLVNPGYNAGRFPVISYGELPFRFNHAVAGSRALDQWYRAYADEEMSDVKFCMAFMHSPARSTPPARSAGRRTWTGCRSALPTAPWATTCPAWAPPPSRLRRPRCGTC